jgi:anhydro-N-acetylmuramic acid kinase
MLVIGLMSGTSLDGMDAALVEMDGEAGRPVWRLRAFTERPYSPEQRRVIHEATLNGTAASLCRLNADMGEWFAEAALRLCDEAGVAPEVVDAIGSHGQTVWHEPPCEGRRGATLQLGCPATIAERTGIPVVSDFRSRDVAAGGEGAPLVPWVDQLLFSHETRRRVLQNIGGMANLTWLPPRGAPEPILAFDTGPGNALMDAAVEMASAGASTYDEGGGWAREGRVDGELLAELLAHPFFLREPPKSTGREAFGGILVRQLAARVRPVSRADWASLIATLTELTARSISSSIHRWVLPRGVDEVIVTGGGAMNPVLVGRLQALLPVPVEARPDALGVPPAAKEAVAFAVLAWAHLRAIPASVPAATGAAAPRVLGSYTPGRQGRPPVP